MQIRFLHDPAKDTGFVGSALTSNMIRFFKTQDESWSHEVYQRIFNIYSAYVLVYIYQWYLQTKLTLQVAISVKPLKVQNWILPEMPGLITDFLISLDDRFLYFVNWLHGDIRQYNIENLKNPKLTGQVWVGGLIQKGSPVVAITDDGETWQAEVPEIQVIAISSSL